MPSVTTTPGMRRLVERLREEHDELVDAALERILHDIPVYERIDDTAFRADVRRHISDHYNAIRNMLARGVPITVDELRHIRPHAAMRARRGVPLAEFLHAFRVGHRALWDWVLAHGDTDDEARAAALATSGPVMDYIDIASTHAAEAYVEAQQLLLAEGDRVRRDLLEDLLAGREPAPGPRRSAALTAGLEAGARCVLVVAVAVDRLDDAGTLRAAGSALARALGGVTPPLVVVRRDEVVIVRALGRDDVRALGERLRAEQEHLSHEDVRLAVGVSTTHRVGGGLESAHREATAALDHVAGEGGVLSLGELSAFEYLTLRGDDTARRLVPDEVRRFVVEDLDRGGVLTMTLREYAAANLSPKVAAERLYVHVNTAHYRLGRIAERTGRDLRCLDDVIELLIAIRLVAAERDQSSGLKSSPVSTLGKK